MHHPKHPVVFPPGFPSTRRRLRRAGIDLAQETVIAIHDVPYEIAKRRQHPHQDAIHAAGWVSLFSLHALWPFLWIWAMAFRPERGWGFSGAPAGQSPAELQDTIARLEARIASLEKPGGGEPG